MPKTKHSNKRHHINLVAEARGGIIPASYYVDEERRVRMIRIMRILRTVKGHLGTVSRVSDDLAITDILADLRHYCDHKELAFNKLDAAAYRLFLEDADDGL